MYLYVLSFVCMYAYIYVINEKIYVDLCQGQVGGWQDTKFMTQR